MVIYIQYLIIVMEITKDIIKNYIKKLNVWNGRSIYLNSHVWRSATRIDLYSLNQVSYRFSYNFLGELLNQHSFKINFEIWWGDNFEFYKNLEENLWLSDEKLIKNFDSLCIKVNKKLDELVDRTVDIYNETGIHNFWFWYPMIWRKLNWKYIYAPLFIWNLELKKVWKNKYEISKQADFDGQINNSLLNYIENNDQIKIENDQKFINEENLKLYLINFFKKFYKKKYDIWDLYYVVPQSVEQSEFFAQLTNEYNLYIDWVFWIYALQKETIKASTEELLDKYDEIICDDESDTKLEYVHPFWATDLDPSQAKILNTLSNDSWDLIIQWPPWTWKSQTITSILTNALQNNQKCLVVCEKKTALEILKKNLENLWLGESFVLIEEANKDRSSIVKNVVNYEKNQTSMWPSDSIDYRLKLSEIKSLISDINKFHSNLNRDIFDWISWNKIAWIIISLQDDVKNSKVLRLLKNYLDTKELDKDVFDDLNWLILRSYDRYDNYWIKYEGLVRKFYEWNGKDLKEAFNIFVKAQKRANDYIIELLEIVWKINEDKNNMNLLFKDYKDNIRYSVDEYENKFNKELGNIERLNEWNILKLKWCDKIFSDIRKQIVLLSRIKINNSKVIDDSMDKMNICNDNIIYKLSEVSGIIDSIENIRKDLKNRKDVILDKIEKWKIKYWSDFMYKNRSGFVWSFKGVNRYANDIFLEFWEYYKIFWLNYENYPISKQLKLDIKSVQLFLKQHSEFLDEPYFSTLSYWDFLSNMKVLSENMKLWNEKLSNLYVKVEELAEVLDIKIKPFDYLSNIQYTIKSLNENLVSINLDYKLFSKVVKWSDFYESLDSEEQNFISIFLSVDSQNWKNYFIYWFFKALLDKNTDAVMSENIDESIEKLDVLLWKFKKSQVKKIGYLLWNRKRDALSKFSSSEWNFKSVFSIRSIPWVWKKSLKQIINSDFDFFTNFFPIVLTNPSCCAQLFEMKKNLFDVVIFDEASQLKIEDSFQCLIRWKRKIICWDENQMPPSDYFASNAYISWQSIVYRDSYTENEDFIQTKKTLTFTNCESLLEFAELSEYKSEMLKIHYRSYHPYLIDFSNEAFYAWELHPFPSKKDYIPMRFIPIEWSYSKKRGVNEEEANYVIEVLRESLEFYWIDDFPSVWIATFNMKQRKLILDKILELQKWKDLFAKQLNKLNPKNFFVKNLDSIQGDERDIIIVSTTFWLDKYDWRFIQNFGPINTEKWFRFLNVMITRARKKIIVVSSIPEAYYNSYEEELKNQEWAYWKAWLYAWLAYVRSVSNKNWEERNHIINILKMYYGWHNSSSGSQIYEISETPFEDKMCETINQNFPGIQVVKWKYEAWLKIDLSLEFENWKKIAIECDWNNINSENEAYAWDIYRKKWIIEKCWYDDFYRVWSINWINNNSDEVRRLLDFLSSKVIK